MKHLRGDGHIFEIRDVGSVILRLRARPDGVPIKFHGQEVLDDDAAREVVRGLIATGLYDRDREA